MYRNIDKRSITRGFGAPKVKKSRYDGLFVFSSMIVRAVSTQEKGRGLNNIIARIRKAHH